MTAQLSASHAGDDRMQALEARVSRLSAKVRDMPRRAAAQIGEALWRFYAAAAAADMPETTPLATTIETGGRRSWWP
jgi:hypothetical protein